MEILFMTVRTTNFPVYIYLPLVYFLTFYELFIPCAVNEKVYC